MKQNLPIHPSTPTQCNGGEGEERGGYAWSVQPARDVTVSAWPARATSPGTTQEPLSLFHACARRPLYDSPLSSCPGSQQPLRHRQEHPPRCNKGLSTVSRQLAPSTRRTSLCSQSVGQDHLPREKNLLPAC